MSINNTGRVLLLAFLWTLLCFNSGSAQYPGNLDIIILVDVSGSMGFSLDGCNHDPGTDINPGTPPHPNDNSCTGCPGICAGGIHENPSWQRMYYIRPGLDALSTVLSRLLLPVTASPPGAAVKTIRFAIGKFPGDAPDDFTWLEAAGDPSLRAYGLNSATELANILNGLTIRWAGTPIGTAISGTDGAIQEFKDNPYTGSFETASVILLFTDGKQYGGVDIYDFPWGSGDGEAHVAFRNDIDQNQETADDDKIKIISMGFGSDTDSETDFEMLKDISRHWDAYDLSSGLTGASFTKRAIYNAFDDIGWGALSLTDPSFVITPDSTQERTNYITEYDQRLLFVVSWHEPKRDSTIQFTIKTISGVHIDPELAQEHPDVEYDVGETFQMYTLRKPFLERNVGECELIINGANIRKPEWCDYSIVGFSTLQLRDVSSAEDLPLFTGDPLPLTISLTADDSPIADARLTARMTGPVKGAGNWFAEYHLTPAQLDSVRALRFAGHVEDIYKKYFYMRHVNGVHLPETNTLEIPLIYDKYDELYRGEFPIITIPGIYKVEVSATHAGAEPDFLFERQVTMNYYIGVKPDLDWTFSSLEFERIAETTEDDSDIYRAKITPKDQYSNFLRPGKEKNFRFSVENARLTGRRVVDDLEGGYYKEIAVPRNAIRPTLRVEYGDFVFQQRVITDNPRRDNWRVNPNVFSLHFGMAVPTDSTANLYDARTLVAIDLSRQLNRHWALIATVGLNTFAGKGVTPDIEYVNISGNIRWLPVVKSSYRCCLNAGSGIYIPDRGSTQAGYNGGAGFGIALSPRLDFEIGGDYHNIVMTGRDFRFFGLHTGFQIRF